MTAEGINLVVCVVICMLVEAWCALCCAVVLSKQSGIVPHSPCTSPCTRRDMHWVMAAHA
jgi:hypothetical protein